MSYMRAAYSVDQDDANDWERGKHQNPCLMPHTWHIIHSLRCPSDAVLAATYLIDAKTEALRDPGIAA